jgi:hypothetical protein
MRNTGAAISDGASDGLTIDAGIDELSGTLSAWQGVGRMSGLIVSTAVGAQIAQKTFAGLLMFLGAWMLASAPVAALVKEELEPSPQGRRAILACTRMLDCVTAGRYMAALKRRATAAESDAAAAAAVKEWAAEKPPPSPSPSLLLAPTEDVDISNPLRGPSSAAAQAGQPQPSPPPPPPPEQLSVYMAGVTLLRHVRRVPVAAFVAFMFLGQFATYISSFPVVLWLQEKKGFSLEEVGILTVIGAFGNMAGCYGGGVGFDVVPSKRLALVAATLLSTFPYLFFLAAPTGVASVKPFSNATGAADCSADGGGGDGGATTTYALTLAEKAGIIFIWVLCSVGYGALYTVQTGQMRLLADSSVAAAYSGLCMGMLAIAAAAGTYVGGVLADGGVGGYDYESCYKGGVYASLAALTVIPWITAADPEVEEFKKAQRAAMAARGGGTLRRRKSFMEWVGALRGRAARDAIVEADAAAAEAAAVAAATGATPPPRPLLRRPALGSMGNLLLAEGDEPTLANRIRSRVRAWFAAPERARARSRRRSAVRVQEWSGTREESPSPTGRDF